MFRHATLSFTITVILLITSNQAQAQATVTFAKGQPTSPGPGRIDGSGSFTVEVGYSVSKVELHASLPKGGQGGFDEAAVDKKAKGFRGQITGLPGGDYKVFARITITKKGSPDLYFDSAVITVTVATP
jgi:hypothetical protein